MRKLKVGFSKGRTAISKAVCALDQSPFSHTFFSFRSDTYDRDLIYQANFLGVYFVNKTNFELHSDILAEIELEVSDELYAKIMQFCIDKTGTMYDFKGLLGKGLVRLGILANNPWDDKLRSVDCSELVNAILIEAGIDTGLTTDSVSPKSIYQVLMARQAVL